MRNQSGSAIVVALLFIFGIGLLAATFLRYTVFEIKNAHRNHDSMINFYVAEAGLDRAIWALNNDDWTGWISIGSTDKLLYNSQFSVGNGRLASYKVLIKNYNAVPVIFSESTTRLPTGQELTKQLRVEMAVDGGAGAGVIAKDFIDLSGGPSFDSYDSSKGKWDYDLNRGDEITIATIGSDKDSFKISSDVDIYGYAGTGGSQIEFSGSNITVHGEDTPDNVDIDMSRISQDFAFDFPPIDQPSWNGAIDKLPDANNGTITIGVEGGMVEKYYIDKINLSDLDLEIVGPVQIYLTDGMSISGDAQMVIEEKGSLELYTPKDVTLSGQALANMTDVPANAVFYGTVNKANDQSLTLSGQAEMQAVFYMPNAQASVSGQVDLSGSLVANAIKFSDKTKYHYDVQLGGGGVDIVGIASWYELNKPSERINFTAYADLLGN